jgi:hypothetical protein
VSRVGRDKALLSFDQAVECCNGNSDLLGGKAAALVNSKFHAWRRRSCIYAWLDRVSRVGRGTGRVSATLLGWMSAAQQQGQDL